ncbi:hypothetical protein [Hyphococcus lacteus]|uniref:Uncharacterized protein n=1 Tax=Hyphococcus lacteus TaxID=3143536 RepID=A0ABV3Z0L7_9PROT
MKGLVLALVLWTVFQVGLMFSNSFRSSPDALQIYSGMIIKAGKPSLNECFLMMFKPERIYPSHLGCNQKACVLVGAFFFKLIHKEFAICSMPISHKIIAREKVSNRKPYCAEIRLVTFAQDKIDSPIFPSKVHSKFVNWRLPPTPNLVPKKKYPFIKRYGYWNELNISARLRLTNPPGFARYGDRFTPSRIEQNHPSQSSKKHQHRPERHVFLGAQILFRAILIPLGFIIAVGGAWIASHKIESPGERLAMTQIAALTGFVCLGWGAYYFV